MTEQIVIKRFADVDDSHLPASLPPLLRQIYARRGVSDAQQLQLRAQHLLHFSGLRGIDAAVAILSQALTQQQRICVCGDFDADGATSTALMISALQAFGAQQVDYLVPNRFADGYGLSPSVVAQAVALKADVIVTVDNGIACFDGVAAAKAAGLTVIITDHHLAAAELPAADAIVNPNQPGCAFVSKHLAGVGVAFYLLLALRAELREQGWQSLPQLADWLDLVALGTVADVVPLDANNRILVQQGLQRIRAGRCRPGIRALLDVAGRDNTRLQASDLGFAVAPRINAAGRLDDMALGIECLLANSDSRAYAMANQLDKLNRERRDIEQQMRDQAEQIVAQLSLNEKTLPPLICLYQAGWHQGVIGIVAGRVKERFHRPVIVFADDDDGQLKGSCRSIDGVHIRDLLERVHNLNPGLISRFGGHAMAAGLTLAQQDLQRFSEQAQAVASAWLDKDQLNQTLWSDGELDSAQLTQAMVEQLEQAGPWGQGFAEPRFDGEFSIVSQRMVADKHLKLVLQSDSGTLVDAIAFNVDTGRWPNTQVTRLQLYYRAQINEFRGRRSVQLLVEHLSPLG
ncbi:hypothetical protein A10D4_04420 [Idiomarina xiamenensis 10-D-4]|uniref:Single-stranded-DNA-specific exonuclease RecJ n=1 Tax=Idiomarina xiamenensis 10-D-4 TaxID=740709 RepID=K2KAH6_9GAMM|nr:hypothetical protein A10D4_04420 [Idiomarina xiamenensis 10-D-4]